VASVAWEPYTEAAFQQALARHEPMVIDIYADWCIPCVELDHMTFRDPEVVSALSSVRTLRLDATSEVPAGGEALLERYDIYGVPTILLIDRHGQERRALRVLGFVPPEEFLERLRQIR
jgi:thiol:disulfide interchange protein DsbD